jgi:hypothetical protein
MSTTSQYFGLWGPFNGPFQEINTAHSGDIPFKETSVGGGIVLTVDRPNAEVAVHLSKQIATDATVGAVSKALIASGASLTSDIRVQGVPWISVPYFWQNPLAHSFSDMLARIDFDFLIHTPWYCSDATGTISVYVLLFLDSHGHLQGHVDGAWWERHGGDPFCTGPVDSGLDAAIPGVKTKVKPILDNALKAASAIKFKRMYFLPGHGTKAPGLSSGDGRTDLTLALIPA